MENKQKIVIGLAIGVLIFACGYTSGKSTGLTLAQTNASNRENLWSELTGVYQQTVDISGSALVLCGDSMTAVLNDDVDTLNANFEKMSGMTDELAALRVHRERVVTDLGL